MKNKDPTNNPEKYIYLNLHLMDFVGDFPIPKWLDKTYIQLRLPTDTFRPKLPSWVDSTGDPTVGFSHVPDRDLGSWVL